MGRCLLWERRTLEHLLSKEPQLATVMHHILSRDIVDKLYQLTPQVRCSLGVHFKPLCRGNFKTPKVYVLKKCTEALQKACTIKK